MRYFALLVFSLMSINAYTQEMSAPDSVYVSTRCTIEDGYSMTDVVEEFRATDANGPLRVFVRQPIASQDWAENEFIRIVVWESMEAWADGVSIVRNETHRCSNAQRRFYTNRRVGTNSTAYEDGVSLVTTMRCDLKKGVSISDVYNTLNRNQLSREQDGDTSVLQFSHLLLGPSPNIDMRSSIVIRRVGSTEVGLAQSLDMMWEDNLSVGTPPNAPASHCQNPSLWRSYLVSDS